MAMVMCRGGGGATGRRQRRVVDRASGGGGGNDGSGDGWCWGRQFQAFFFSYLALFCAAIANLALLQKSKRKIEQRIRVCMLVYIGDREEIWDVGSQSHCKITRLILGEKQSNDV